MKKSSFLVATIYNIVEFLRGDITLLPDLPILNGHEERYLTKGYYYTGPIFSKMEMPVLPEITKVF